MNHKTPPKFVNQFAGIVLKTDKGEDFLVHEDTPVDWMDGMYVFRGREHKDGEDSTIRIFMSDEDVKDLMAKKKAKEEESSKKKTETKKSK